MTVFVNRSIPLSQESREAWRNVATIIPRQHRNRLRVLDRIQPEDVVINLGLSDAVGRDCIVYNDPVSIRSVLTPQAIRNTMPDLLPPRPGIRDAFWRKGPGQHGNGVSFYDGGMIPPDRPGYDLQKHIEGTEYRVITVGELVVQATRKTNAVWVNGRHSFDWQWIGVVGARQVSGLIPLAKRAVGLVPNGPRTVLGWDIISGTDGGVYVIECNSSPGVNEATARRIVRAIQNR